LQLIFTDIKKLLQCKAFYVKKISERIAPAALLSGWPPAWVNSRRGPFYETVCFNLEVNMTTLAEDDGSQEYLELWSKAEWKRFKLAVKRPYSYMRGDQRKEYGDFLKSRFGLTFTVEKNKVRRT
jgi:hypothetical protein